MKQIELVCINLLLYAINTQFKLYPAQNRTYRRKKINNLISGVVFNAKFVLSFDFPRDTEYQ